jgi:cytochrome c-type biogenesis protein CcmE
MSTIGSVPFEEQAENKQARPRKKKRPPLSFMIAGVVILAAIAYLIYSNTQSNAMYYMTIPELRTCTTCMTQDVRVEGVVQKGSIQANDTMQQLSFVIADGNQSLPVVYNGVVPDIFSVGIQVVIEGRYGGQGAFQAQTLLTKCPSKFTAATPTP